MAYEIIDGPATGQASTGLRQYRAVRMGTNGYLGYPNASTIGQPIDGVIVTEGTTGSTADPQFVGIQTEGIVKMEAESSTLAVGDYVSASSVGRAQTCTNTGDFRIGRVWAGSSGGANRVISVLLSPIGSTVAPA